jgi:prepilin-type N-terminal cleavage/methylation domain-containing protein/prepilin-type processing-associated H-X9-DG protein
MKQSQAMPSATRDTGPGDRGLTIIEVLVAVGILGLLVAIVLPAVQQSRMAAMRIDCSDHLRQIGLAAQQYHETYGHLPDHQMLYRLFPYLGLQNWFDAGVSERDLGKWHPVLLCPLDRLHDPGESPSPYSYLAAGGSCLGCGEGILRSGPITEEGISWNEVTDGLSGTALFSERRASLHETAVPLGDEARAAACQADPVRCIWQLRSAFGPGQDVGYVAACGDPQHRSAPRSPNDKRVYWSEADKPYGHVLPPNTPSGYRGYPFETSHSLAASSHHTGGVNLLLCDGAVRFVADTIHVPLWWAIGTRNGNDVVGEF